MRIILENNKQKELIEKERKTFNLSFLQLANNLSIKEGKLKAYYYDGILMPEEIFYKFQLSYDFKKHIMGKKQLNWGQSEGGKNSNAGYVKDIRIPEESMDLAEFYGIMLGDGNLTKIKKYKVGVYQLTIVGDSRHDYEYLVSYIKPLIVRLFNIDLLSYKRKESNAFCLVMTGKKLVEFMETKGFKPGDKIKNQLDIPAWIKNNKDYLKVCLRGLFDTDGCVYKLTNQNSHQIAFRNYNETLLKSAREGLINLGISPSNITNKSIIITKKSELRKFLKEVGFSNIKHLNKVKMWKLAL